MRRERQRPLVEIRMANGAAKEPEKPADAPRRIPLFGSWSEEVEKGKPRWTYLVAPLLTFIGTMVTIIGLGLTLYFTNLTYRQNTDKNRQERAENAVRRLEDQFKEVQSRLSGGEGQTRAVAVMQLADLAQTSLPTEALDDIEPGKVRAEDFSRKHYPFFLRVVRQYATSLPVEKDPVVRAADKDAVYLLVRFLQKFKSPAELEALRNPTPTPVASPTPTATVAPATPGKATPTPTAKPTTTTTPTATPVPAPTPDPNTLPKTLYALDPEYVGASYEITDADGNKQTIFYNITETDVVLAEMTNELADATRKAKDDFIRAYASYTVKEGSIIRDALEAEEIQPAPKGKSLPQSPKDRAAENEKKRLWKARSNYEVRLTAVNFCGTSPEGKKATGICLTDLQDTPLFQTQRTTYTAKREAQNEKTERPQADAKLLEEMEQSARRLTDTRDALATTLTGYAGFGPKDESEYLPPAKGVPTEALIKAQEEIGSASAELEKEGLTEAAQKGALERLHIASELVRNLLHKWTRKPAARLEECFLTGAYLREAQLQGADLSAAQLQGADLRGARLQGADLSAAQLQGADLREAQLQGADLSVAQLQGADLRGEQWQGADLSVAQLQGADLHGAQLQGANLSEARLQRAVLRGARLQGADLSLVWLQGADLSLVWLQKANLSRAQLQGADLSRAQLQGADLRLAQFDNKTSLYAISVQETDNSKAGAYPQTNFNEANWWDARFDLDKDALFKTPKKDKQSRHVWDWLKKTFPRPTPSKP